MRVGLWVPVIYAAVFCLLAALPLVLRLFPAFFTSFYLLLILYALPSTYKQRRHWELAPTAATSPLPVRITLYSVPVATTY